MNRKQDQPEPTNAECNTLEQPSVVYQSSDLPETGAGNNEQYDKRNASNHRIGSPALLAQSVEQPRKHKAGDGQTQEDKGREEAMKAPCQSILHRQ
jgi:hypothetical protein